MNKGKLRSLMFHAGFCNEDGGWDNRPIWEQEHDNFQRFAELIVRECIAKVEMRKKFAIEDQHIVDHAFNLLVYDLESHFGVE